MQQYIKATLMGALVSLSLPVLAATDGELGVGPGATSMGKLQVSLYVHDLVRISGLDDIRLAAQPDTGDFQGNDRLCVSRNLSGRYSVVAHSNNGAGAGFALRHADSQVAYGVRWNGRNLVDGIRSDVLGATNRTVTACDGGGNVSLEVRSTAAQLRQATREGLYTDTLVLMVAAE